MQIIFGLLLCFVLCLSVEAKLTEPLLSENRVVFSNGKELRLETSHAKRSNSSEVLQGQQSISVDQRAILVRNWHRVLVVGTRKKYEGELKEISVYDYEGKLLSAPLVFEGEVIVLEKAKRIFLAQKSFHRLIQHSMLLNVDGKELQKISQSTNLIKFEVSPDERLVWILSSHLRNGRPFVVATAIDLEGKVIGEIDAYREEEKELIYDGRRYTIKLPQPQVPG